ncbi:TackOD1 domain-containing metal-binding protein [Natrialba swarupiae]|uniref:Thaumarchaeal output domain-containing protein n=1 Tax=Natrialba swarupiae TaxID=2448032 RepID=A0A5D5AV39_9EURY|nr:hypothetical protein [Natrialba swarupiae]TYT63732.1 hypothetical protein FYC77_00450 [Natrialba swarupiae]
MVSPGKLRAVSELHRDDRDAFEPSIDETGDVTYPAVERHLDERDGTAIDVLEAMADSGVLSSSFEHKVYVCPNCAAEGMQYSTGCPSCSSVHGTWETTVVHPECGEPLEEPPDDDAAHADASNCPDCDADVARDDLERGQHYRCHDCDSWTDSPVHRLWCRECPRTYPPAEAREQPLNRYYLTSAGERWLADQQDARRSLAQALESRGYETSVDVSPPAAETELPVHVYAEDDLLDDRIVAGVHDSPDSEDVRRLAKIAREVDARPIVLSTNGSVDEGVAEILDAEDVTMVSATGGDLSSEYRVEPTGGDDRLLDRVRSFVSSSTARS